ncbi:MAG TPA: GNAT family N-acetyltransferase [Vicinamibacterales bacterium]|nr:GNAT family N-acetyltransferase [Vicinamibacterales bacterium]
MPVHTLDPLDDPRWETLVCSHPAASVFHTRAWLHALRRTYGYQSLVYTTSPPEAPLTNGIVVCGVRSWLTGCRLVSVPFADHCDPLVRSASDMGDLIGSLHEATRHTWKYVELRPRPPVASPDRRLQESATFRLHAIDLRAERDEIYRRMHESGIRRKIRRAEREGLRYEEGRSEALLDAFYQLLIRTRKRHGVPPPPKRWFLNLLACVGEAAKIRVAWKDRRAIGSIITLQHRTTLVYKYGASDSAFHNLGAMPFLFWRAIEDGKTVGLHTFDLGRSDLTNTGLITFKKRLGGVSSTLTYFRCSARLLRQRRTTTKRASRLFACMPEPLLVLAGRLLYRHMG